MPRALTGRAPAVLAGPARRVFSKMVRRNSLRLFPGSSAVTHCQSECGKVANVGNSRQADAVPGHPLPMRLAGISEMSGIPDGPMAFPVTHCQGECGNAGNVGNS